MRDTINAIKHWLEGGQTIALATVVQTWGSSPREVGSKMAITSEGEFAGSVSGGCVENAVIEAARQSLETGRPRLLHFGVADETAWEVGLACGGSIDVFVKPLEKTFFAELESVIKKEQPAILATVVRGPDDVLGHQLLMNTNCPHSKLFGDSRDDQIANLASEILSRGQTRRVSLDNEVELFFEAILPSPVLVAVGGVHISVALASIAKVLGYRTIVIDPRKAWGSMDRFPHVDTLIQAWPEEAFQQIEVTTSTAIAMLTHDPKLDDPAIKIALSSPAFYIGALGSKTTNAQRRERLLKEGVSQSQLSRLHAPIGLDIGAKSPEEIALAIMAEVVDAERKRKQAAAEVEAILQPINH